MSIEMSPKQLWLLAQLKEHLLNFSEIKILITESSTYFNLKFYQCQTSQRTNKLSFYDYDASKLL